MSRDVLKLRVFHQADELMIQLYRATSALPREERYGIQSQIRRAALSIPVNIVEGSARRTLREYVNFLNTAAASAAEVTYLLSVIGRLEMLPASDAKRFECSYRDLFKSLRAMLRALDIARD